MHPISDIVLTHAGKFHADDVFSAALLRILKPGVEIRRVYQVPEGFDGLAFDIGWGEFDHHQAGAPVRPNGVPYAAFGLLWREYGPCLLLRRGTEVWQVSFTQLGEERLPLEDWAGSFLATLSPSSSRLTDRRKEASHGKDHPRPQMDPLRRL